MPQHVIVPMDIMTMELQMLNVKNVTINVKHVVVFQLNV